MKKYKLKEELNEYLSNTNPSRNYVMTLDEWITYGYGENALVEVPSRILLDYEQDDVDSFVINTTLTKEQIDLCEKALNGELNEYSFIDILDFNKWQKRHGIFYATSKSQGLYGDFTRFLEGRIDYSCE